MAANNEKNINKNLERREQKAFEKHAELMEKAEKLKIDVESLDKEMDNYGNTRNKIFESNQAVEKQQQETEEALQKIERLLFQFSLSSGNLQFERSQVTTTSLSGKYREQVRETKKDFVLTFPEGYSVQSVDGKKPNSGWCRKVEKNGQELRISHLTMMKLDGKELVLTGPEGEIKCAIEVTKGTNANGEIEASIKEAPKLATQPEVEPAPAAPATPDVAIAPAATTQTANTPSVSPDQKKNERLNFIRGTVHQIKNVIDRSTKEGQAALAKMMEDIFCFINDEKIVNLEEVQDIFEQGGFKLDLAKDGKLQLSIIPTPEAVKPAPNTPAEQASGPNIGAPKNQALKPENLLEKNLQKKVSEILARQCFTENSEANDELLRNIQIELQTTLRDGPRLTSAIDADSWKKFAAEINAQAKNSTTELVVDEGIDASFEIKQKPGVNKPSSPEIQTGSEMYNTLINNNGKKDIATITKEAEALAKLVNGMSQENRDAFFLSHPISEVGKTFINPNVIINMSNEKGVLKIGVMPKPKEAARNEVEDTLKTLKTKIDTSKGLAETKSALEDAAQALSSMTETLDKNQIKNIENKGFSFGNKIYSLKLDGLVFVVKNRNKPKEKAPTQIVKEEIQKVIREFQALQNTRNKKIKKPDLEQLTMLAGTLSEGVQKIQSIEGFPSVVLSPNAEALVTDTEKKLENVKIGSDTYKLVYNHASFEFRIIQLENTPAPAPLAPPALPPLPDRAPSPDVPPPAPFVLPPPPPPALPPLTNIPNAPTPEAPAAPDSQSVNAARLKTEEEDRKNRLPLEEKQERYDEAEKQYDKLIKLIKQGRPIPDIKNQVATFNTTFNKMERLRRETLMYRKGTNNININKDYDLVWDEKAEKLRVQKINRAPVAPAAVPVPKPETQPSTPPTPVDVPNPASTNAPTATSPLSQKDLNKLLNFTFPPAINNPFATLQSQLSNNPSSNLTLMGNGSLDAPIIAKWNAAPKNYSDKSTAIYDAIQSLNAALDKGKKDEKNFTKLVATMNKINEGIDDDKRKITLTEDGFTYQDPELAKQLKDLADAQKRAKDGAETAAQFRALTESLKPIFKLDPYPKK